MKQLVLAWGLVLWFAGGALAAPIHDAAEAGDTAKLQQLLDSGAKPNDVRPGDEATPLHIAVFAGHQDAAALLIKAGADVNAHTKGGYTPLHLAALKGSAGLVKLLLDNGAEIDPVAVDGTTPLHMAVISGNITVVQSLLDAGADRMIRDFRGRMPIDVATVRGYDAIAKAVSPSQEATPSIYRDGTAAIEKRIQQMDASIARYRATVSSEGTATSTSDLGSGQAAASAGSAPQTTTPKSATPSTEDLLSQAGALIDRSKETAAYTPTGIDAAVAAEEAKGEPNGLNAPLPADQSSADPFAGAPLAGNTSLNTATLSAAEAFLREHGATADAADADTSAAPAASTASAVGKYSIQLAAVTSKDRAEREWTRLKTAHPDLFVALNGDVQEADLGDKRTVYRLRTGPLTKDRATSICDNLAESHENCLVVKR